jgi:4-hydroxy-tetrahydrodipicolinate synthase
MQAIEGVYVANVTPFEDDASMKIDVDAYLAHASWLGRRG